MLNNVPVPGQSLGASRGLINTNFSTIDTAFSVDHVPYNDGSGNQGQHNKITFPVQSSAPSFIAGVDGLYNLTSTLTSLNELFIHRQSFAGSVDLPFTASILSTSTPGNISAGWTYLPSGILIKWGVSLNANGSTVITFPTGANIPAFNACFTVIPQISQSGTTDVNQAIRLTAATATTFTVYGSSRTTTGAAAVVFSYIAIGY